jgi:hypothetical protein
MEQLSDFGSDYIPQEAFFRSAHCSTSRSGERFGLNTLVGKWRVLGLYPCLRALLSSALHSHCKVEPDHHSAPLLCNGDGLYRDHDNDRIWWRDLYPVASWGCHVSAYRLLPEMTSPCDMLVVDFDIGRDKVGRFPRS